MTDGGEIVRRRARVPKGSVVEAWPDVLTGGAYWIGEQSKALLDAAGEPLRSQVTVPAEAVPVYYGPQVADLESLPREESLRARVLSVHGIAVAWITLEPTGERASHEPNGPADPVFHLRRPGGGAAHVWRRFATRDEAIAFMRGRHGADSEAAEWARTLPAADFDDLLRRHAQR